MDKEQIDEIDRKIHYVKKCIIEEIQYLKDYEKVDSVRFYNKTNGISSTPGFTFHPNFPTTKELIEFAKNYSKNKIKRHKKDLIELLNQLTNEYND